MAKRKTSKKLAVEPNALDEGDIDPLLDKMSGDQLSLFIDRLHRLISLWHVNATPESIDHVRATFPELDVINFEKVYQRFPLPSPPEGSIDRILPTSISEVVPELSVLLSAAGSRFRAIPKSIAKAEQWLYSMSMLAGGDADLEAAIYFASRGRTDAFDLDKIQSSWHSNICYDILHRGPVGDIPDRTQDRAKNKTITLAEAAGVLEFNHKLPRFFSFRDEEEDFIDATFIRAVEWLGIQGFSPWVDSTLEVLSLGPDGQIDPRPAAWWLFCWCRSDLAIRMAERPGLEGWLWALVNGQNDRAKPWQIFWAEQQHPRMRDSLIVASSIPFVWTRIAPQNINSNVLDSAIDLIMGSQLKSGPWPDFVDSSEPCPITTCLAIHSLSLVRPTGWREAVRKASIWLEGIQDEASGTWNMSGGPTVFLTVLILDSISLANDSQTATFRSSSDEKPQVQGEKKGSEKPRLFAQLILIAILILLELGCVWVAHRFGDGINLLQKVGNLWYLFTLVFAVVVGVGESIITGKRPSMIFKHKS